MSETPTEQDKKSKNKALTPRDEAEFEKRVITLAMDGCSPSRIAQVTSRKKSFIQDILARPHVIEQMIQKTFDKTSRLTMKAMDNIEISEDVKKRLRAKLEEAQNTYTDKLPALAKRHVTIGLYGGEEVASRTIDQINKGFGVYTQDEKTQPHVTINISDQKIALITQTLKELAE